MEYTQLAKQMIDFQKMSFSNWYDTVVLLQDQATSAMNLALQQNVWLPKEGQKTIQDWLDASQQEPSRFRKYVDKTFADLEKNFSKSKKSAQSLTKKQETSPHQQEGQPTQ